MSPSGRADPGFGAIEDLRLRGAEQPSKMPWRSGGSAAKDGNSASMMYLRACDRGMTLPKLMPCLTGHAPRLLAENQGLCDPDLQPIAEMIDQLPELKELDLTGNALLTHRSLVPLLQRIVDCPNTAQGLEVLRLRGCLNRALPEAVQETVGFISGSIKHNLVKSLHHLDLGGIHMSMRCSTALCKALGKHEAINTIGLADTRLGDNVNAAKCLEDMVSNLSLESLDVGWNAFNDTVCQHFAEVVADARRLRTLRVANCSTFANETPSVMFLIERLAANQSLTRFDVSLNRLDFSGALLLEDALEKHKSLVYLDANSNPMGVIGLRSMLRLMLRETNKILHFSADDCFGALASEEARPSSDVFLLQTDEVSRSEKVFSATNPAGWYDLDLRRHYHRALLRMIYKSCERFKVNPNEAIQFAPGTPSIKHPERDGEGLYNVPTHGHYKFDFSIQEATKAAMKGVDNDDFTTYLQRYYRMVRIRPEFKKVIPLMSLWRGIEGEEMNQKMFLNALSQDFVLTYPQIAQLCRSVVLTSDIVWRCLRCLDGQGSMHWYTMLLTPNKLEYTALLKNVWKFLAFNPENPTGRYKLDLDNAAHHAVAERLCLLDGWEMVISKLKGQADVSQRRNQSRIRNEIYKSQSLKFVKSLMAWTLPENGVLQFDYVSGKRPPVNAHVLDDTTLTSILLRLPLSGCNEQAQLECLRMVSHHFCISALQMRNFMGNINARRMRQEVVVLLFLRVVDMHNEKVFRVRFDNQEDIKELQLRLGNVTFFPFIQPEQMYFTFDFAVQDQRLAANILVNIAQKETLENIREYTFRLPSGEYDPMTLGIPASWLSLDKMPEEGVFHGHYMCAPENRKFEYRCSVMETNGFWTPPPSTKQVLWWADLSKAPPDVLEFMEWLCGRFKSLDKAYERFDGPGGSGKLARDKFNDALAALKCEKFKCRDKAEEQARCRAVFDYLDPGKEGNISLDEWMAMDALLQEILLSASEFAGFLERHYGTLSEAWSVMDDDGSDEISELEWVQAVQNLGYFGLTKPLFGFLDKSEKGALTPNEFLELDSLRAEWERRFRAICDLSSE